MAYETHVGTVLIVAPHHRGQPVNFLFEPDDAAWRWSVRWSDGGHNQSVTVRGNLRVEIKGYWKTLNRVRWFNAQDVNTM